MIEELNLTFFVVLAFLIEALAFVVLSLYTPDSTKKWHERIDWKLLVAIVFGQVVAFGAKADIFVKVEVPLSPPGLAYVLTGLLLARGSNFAHELITFVYNARKVKAAQAAAATAALAIPKLE